MWAVVVIVGTALASVTFFATSNREPPRLHWVSIGSLWWVAWVCFWGSMVNGRVYPAGERKPKPFACFFYSERNRLIFNGDITHMLFRFFVCFLDLFIFMCMFGLHTCLCTLCMPGTLRGQKRALDPLRQELPAVTGHPMWAPGTDPPCRSH